MLLITTYILLGEFVILQAENISKAYGNKTNSILPILNNISFTVKAGESIAILGPSGCGKTTLLSLLAGLDKPDSGRIFFGDQDLATLSRDALARLRGEKIGIIFQEYHLIPALTALENIALPLEIAGDKKATDKAMDLLHKVGLAKRGQHYPHQLSGGEQQRVAIARALIIKPMILFADEPTGSLDEKTAFEIEELIFKLIAEENLTALLITHNQNLAKRCHRILRLHLGQFQ